MLVKCVGMISGDELLLLLYTVRQAPLLSSFCKEMESQQVEFDQGHRAHPWQRRDSKSDLVNSRMSVEPSASPTSIASVKLQIQHQQYRTLRKSDRDLSVDLRQGHKASSRTIFNQMLFSPFLKYVILSNLSSEDLLKTY